VIGYARLLRQDVVRCGGGAHESYLASLHAAGPRWRGWLRRIQPLHRSILAIERRQYQPGRYCRVLAVSQAVKADLMRVHGVPAAAVAVIPGGVDTVRFHPRLREEHRAAVRAAYRIPSNARCLLFVGNGFRRKGLETLLRAMAVEPDPDLHALVVGTDPDAGRYRELACRLGVGGRVVFTGAVTDTERYYAAADVLVLPAVQEAFGNVVLEALAAGLPAVVSACAGAAEVLGNGLEEGLLCDPLDHRELAARVKSLLAGSVAGVYAAPARRVAESYSMTASLDRTETLFRETIREKTESRAGVAENSGAKVAF
jgi:UDP-glucose:(heptosyl)LPS alpha-1,3-glucosyltransferase